MFRQLQKVRVAGQMLQIGELAAARRLTPHASVRFRRRSKAHRARHRQAYVSSATAIGTPGSFGSPEICSA